MSKSLKPNGLLVRCFAEQEGTQWVAVCVDFNLAAQADTYEAARDKLHEQIRSYLYDAWEGEDKEFATQLLARKAPLGIRARYYMLAAVSHVDHVAQKLMHARAFKDALPFSVQMRTAA